MRLPSLGGRCWIIVIEVQGDRRLVLRPKLPDLHYRFTDQSTFFESLVSCFDISEIVAPGNFNRKCPVD